MKITKTTLSLMEQCTKLIPVMNDRERGLIGLTLMEVRDRLEKENHIEEK